MKFPWILPAMPVSSVQDWLDRELEVRGIDAVVYTRYILSILQQEGFDSEPIETDLFSYNGKKKEAANKSKGKKLKCLKPKMHDCEELKKNAAVECLLSVSDQKFGIQELVDELCAKLKSIQCSGTIIHKEKCSEKTSLGCGQISENFGFSSLEEQAEKYYAAFPALSGGAESHENSIEAGNTHSAWDCKKHLDGSTVDKRDDSDKNDLSENNTSLGGSGGTCAILNSIVEKPTDRIAIEDEMDNDAKTDTTTPLFIVPKMKVVTSRGKGSTYNNNSNGNNNNNNKGKWKLTKSSPSFKLGYFYNRDDETVTRDIRPDGEQIKEWANFEKDFEAATTTHLFKTLSREFYNRSAEYNNYLSPYDPFYWNDKNIDGVELNRSIASIWSNSKSLGISEAAANLNNLLHTLKTNDNAGQSAQLQNEKIYNCFSPFGSYIEKKEYKVYNNWSIKWSSVPNNCSINVGSRKERETDSLLDDGTDFPAPLPCGNGNSIWECGGKDKFIKGGVYGFLQNEKDEENIIAATSSPTRDLHDPIHFSFEEGEPLIENETKTPAHPSVDGPNSDPSWHSMKKTDGDAAENASSELAKVCVGFEKECRSGKEVAELTNLGEKFEMDLPRRLQWGEYNFNWDYDIFASIESDEMVRADTLEDDGFEFFSNIAATFTWGNGTFFNELSDVWKSKRELDENIPFLTSIPLPPEVNIEECGNAADVKNSTLQSTDGLLKLNHKGESRFVRVHPGAKIRESVPRPSLNDHLSSSNNPGSDNLPPSNPDADNEEEENLLISPRTHFRPIRQNSRDTDASSSSDESGIFPIPVVETEFLFTETEDGSALYINNEHAPQFGRLSSRNKYMLFKGQEAASGREAQIFIPKFKLRSGQEKFCQTEDTENENTATSIEESNSKNETVRSYEMKRLSDDGKDACGFDWTCFRELPWRFREYDDDPSSLAKNSGDSYLIFENSKGASTFDNWNLGEIDEMLTSLESADKVEPDGKIRKERSAQAAIAEVPSVWSNVTEEEENDKSAPRDVQDLKYLKDEIKQEEIELFEVIKNVHDLKIDPDWEPAYKKWENQIFGQSKCSTSKNDFSKLNFELYEDEEDDGSQPGKTERDLFDASRWEKTDGTKDDPNSAVCQDFLIDFQDTDESFCCRRTFPAIPSNKVIYSSDLEEEWRKSEKPFVVQVPKKKFTKQIPPQKRPCSFFMEGNCHRTDCKFSHDLATITCRFWEEGSCFKGITCPFLHGYPRNRLLKSQPTQKKKDHEPV